VSFDYAVVRVLRVLDGDTLDAVLDLGLGVSLTERLRVLGVDTPERGKPGAVEATRYTTTWLTIAHIKGGLRVATHKTDSFGRYLADAYDNTTGEHLADALIREGHAVPYTRAQPKETI
jgi:endonuclease YncB( thermonuclease family)